MSACCLVLEPVGLIAEDLAAMVLEVRPDARIIGVRTVAEAEAMVKTADRIDIAFLNAPPKRLMNSALGAMLRDAGTQIVFVGHALEAEEMGLRYLEQPFAAEAVERELPRVTGAGQA